jgi:hypothetical protein
MDSLLTLLFKLLSQKNDKTIVRSPLPLGVAFYLGFVFRVGGVHPVHLVDKSLPWILHCFIVEKMGQQFLFFSSFR